MKTKTKKWGISKVQPKQKRTYMTKKRKAERTKKEYLFIGVFLTIGVGIIMGFSNINISEIKANLEQGGIRYQLEAKKLSEGQILSERAMFCKMLTPEQQIIKEVADMREFKDIELLFCLAYEESKYKQYAIGVNKHYQSNGEVWFTKDRGIFQINSYWHKEISDECTMDIACSVNETISILNKDGGCKSWSTCGRCSDL